MSISIIVAVDKNGVIGKNNKIPWYIKEDFHHFKQTTLNSVVLMGRKTWFSLPKRPLSERINIVISSTKQENCFCFTDINDALLFYKKEYPLKNLFVIGGSSIYYYFLKNNLVDRIIMSHVHGEYDGDSFFPMQYLENYQLTHSLNMNSFTIKEYTA